MKTTDVKCINCGDIVSKENIVFLFTDPAQIQITCPHCGHIEIKKENG